MLSTTTLASPTRVSADRKSGGPINKFKAIIAVATEANCSPHAENFTEHVLAKPNATPAWVTCAIHATLRCCSSMFSEPPFSGEIEDDDEEEESKRLAILHAIKIPSMRNATNNTAACALRITCSISNATPASVKKTKLTAGCKETNDECNDFDPMALNNCCCANLFVVVVVVVVALVFVLPPPLDGDGGELVILKLADASLS